MFQEQKPSNILHRISSQSPTSVFINALERNLYPLLDELSLDARSRIIGVLELVEQEVEADTASLIDVVNYDIHEKSLNEQVKALEKHCRRNWHRSSEIQAEMMMKIAKEVIQWLPHLWQIGVEKGWELDLVQKCLVLCTTIIIRVTKCGSFTEFCEIEFALVISDTIGNVVYKDNTYLLQSIAWVWRELLVSATSRHRSPNGILADIRRLQFEEEVYEYLKRGNAEERMGDGRGYWDAHWNEDMRAAALSLLDERHQDRVQDFDMRISLTLYEEILSEDPTIKDRLLQITRRQMFEDKDRLVATDYRTAAQIFRLDSLEDLPALLNVLPGNIDTLEAKRIIFRAWADSNLSASRAKALELLKSGLEEAKKRVLDEVDNAFPYFLTAYDEYLQDLIDREKFTLSAPGDRRSSDPNVSKAVERRDMILDTFIERAKDRDFGGEWQDPLEGYDTADSDYKEQRKRTAPDLKEGILYWLEMLDDWEVREDAERVWDQVKEVRPKDKPQENLFDIDGLAMKLASACDGSYRYNSVKQHVADGLRAAYKVFTCKTITELDQKGYIPKRRASDYDNTIYSRTVPNFD